jgi:tRNA(Ile)-lysidine synthase
VAVSGGADSVALLRATIALNERDAGPGRVYAAHLHHGLRSAADEDQAWLEKLCDRCQVPLETGWADVAALASENADGVEAAARQARYSFLAATAEKLGARVVAVGHTADDQVETILHRILRGTGLSGLAGMPRVRALTPSVALVRPMLKLRRSDVLHYLSTLGQAFCVDASNADTQWMRNYLRKELLPRIRSRVNANVDEALLRLARQADEAQQMVVDQVTNVASRAITTNVHSTVTQATIDCGALRGESPHVVREVCRLAWQRTGWPLQAMGFDEWHLLAELIRSADSPGAVNLPGNVRAWRQSGRLILESPPQ